MPRTTRRARSRPAATFLIPTYPAVVIDANGRASPAQTFKEASEAALLAMADSMRAEVLAIQLTMPDLDDCATDQAPEPRVTLHPLLEDALFDYANP